eukprot:2268929-Pyramimonas_sp.AAC.3
MWADHFTRVPLLLVATAVSPWHLSCVEAGSVSTVGHHTSDGVDAYESCPSTLQLCSAHYCLVSEKIHKVVLHSLDRAHLVWMVAGWTALYSKVAGATTFR